MLKNEVTNNIIYKEYKDQDWEDGVGVGWWMWLKYIYEIVKELKIKTMQGII